MNKISNKYPINQLKWGLNLLIITAMCNVTNAQNFDSGSDGSDGELSLSSTDAEPIVFDPGSYEPPLDADGDGVFHFTTITIAEGTTVRLIGSQPIIWLASGDVTIDGTLDLSGQDGGGSDVIALPGAGGFSGGRGNNPPNAAQNGNGPGGGLFLGRAGGGAGHAQNGLDGITDSHGTAYGNPFLLPLWGGSGGSGGGETANIGGSGGAGGGAILIASNKIITVNGSINANGGNGGEGVIENDNGGGGSGGSIRLIASQISGSDTGSITAMGGKISSSGDGSIGRVRLESFYTSFNGIVNPVTFSTPGLVFLPADATPIRVVSIGGDPVPATTTGSFRPADVTINKAGEVDIEIEAKNVPVGTVVNLNLWNETVGNIKVDSTPLTGEFEKSTATAKATIPHGFSRFLIEAKWDTGSGE